MADGEVFVGGTTAGIVSGTTFFGVGDAFVRAYDRHGGLLWSDQFGSLLADNVQSLAVDDEALYAVGQAFRSLPGQSWSGGSDAFIRSYTRAGALRWTRQFGTPAFDAALAVALDDTGIYVAGRTEGALPGQTPAGNSDAFVRKFDRDGNLLWTLQLGTGVFDQIRSVTTGAGAVYVAGRTDGRLASDTDRGPDAFVARIDPDGPQVLWIRQIGTMTFDESLAAGVGPRGVYVSGRTDGDLFAVSAGSSDVFLVRYGHAGDLQVSTQFGTAQGDFAQGLSAGAAGSGVFVTGRTDGAFPGFQLVGISDTFVRKHANDSEMSHQWTLQIGTTFFDVAFGVSADAHGIYVAGSTEGTLPGATSAGAQDAFLMTLR